MKSKVTISFEEPYDNESEKIYNSLPEFKKAEFLIKYKKQIESVVRSEFARDIENLRIEFEIE